MNMNEIEAIDEIDTLCFTGDVELDHRRADNIICRFLRSLGYDELVDLYEQVDKWYS